MIYLILAFLSPRRARATATAEVIDAVGRAHVDMIRAALGGRPPTGPERWGAHLTPEDREWLERMDRPGGAWR